jgi:transposase
VDKNTILTNLKKYTIQQLMADFPDDAACLAWIVRHRFPDGIICSGCEKTTKHYQVSGRRAYACAVCGTHFYPTNGTIFYNSRVSLTLWFHAIYVISTNKAGTSARQIQRELGVAYCTAWRMMHLIRSTMGNTGEKLNGEVEVDETFVHPNTFKRSSAQRRYGRDSRRTGEVIFGAVQRGGKVKVWHVNGANATTIIPIIRDNIAKGTLIHSDGWTTYRRLKKQGYTHRWTDHGKHQYYTADSYTQNIENVWSHFKRGIKGVYRHIKPAYLQLYANEYAWRYNHRHDSVLFWYLLEDTTLPAFSQ